MQPIVPGTIYREDNREQLAQFEGDSVDLIYLDPPFFTNRKYEVIWGDEAEMRSFADRWQGGINVYVDWMRERMVDLHRILKPTGSLYLHCDPTASHYLRVMLDSIFGYRNFRNEIIWRRSTSHNDARQGLGRYGRVHDVILFYGKSSTTWWNQQYAPVTDSHLTGGYKRVEPETGRRYMEADVTASKPGGDTEYDWHGVRPYKNRYWAYSRENMEQFEREGRLIYRRTGMPRLKVYLDESKGVPLTDVWNDIGPISATSTERMGYPTQKPVDLLRRIVGASCPPNGLVLDPFCGCGTTVVAAAELGRQWAGIDISPTACELIRRRLDKLGIPVRIEKMPVKDAQLRALKHFEFQNMVIAAMDGIHNPKRTSDGGIDGYTWFEHWPIQVKQSDAVGRNVVDNFETAIERAQYKNGIIVAFSFTKGAIEEAARARTAKGLNIQLLKAVDLFADRRPRSTLPDGDVRLPPRPLRRSAQELLDSASVTRQLVLDGLAATVAEEEAAEDEARAAEESVEYDTSN